MPSENFNVVLIGIDTLRADHLGYHGYHRQTSPDIDAIAKESIVFKNCFAQAPITSPSFMSVMTGRYPTYHGVTSNIGATGRNGRAYTLDNNIPTLAQILKREGYRTGAFTDGGNLYGKLGFERGFDYYSMNMEYGTKMPGLIPENDIFRWVREYSKEKFFLFFHTFAVHNPWAIPDKYLTVFGSGYTGKLLIDHLLTESLKKPGRSPRLPFLRMADTQDQADMDYLKAIYDGAIKYVNDFISKLNALLKELRIADNTILIFTADHGEEFFEHGILGHKQFYDELLHVPLFMKIPGIKTSSEINDIVQSVDILPTILKLLEIKNELKVHGTQLPFQSTKNPKLIAVAQADGLGYSIRDNKYKYLYPENISYKIRADELYDLENDPKEKNNIALKNLDIVEEMLHRLEQELHARVKMDLPRRKIIYLKRPKN